MNVHYAEGKGAAARAARHAFLNALPGRPGFLGAELLLSPDQPELTLLPLPEPKSHAGTSSRAWRALYSVRAAISTSTMSSGCELVRKGRRIEIRIQEPVD